MPNIIDAENLFSEISKVFASYYRDGDTYESLLEDLSGIIFDEYEKLENE